jgi:hypothetical protein
MITYSIVLIIGLASGDFLITTHYQAAPDIGMSNIESCESFLGRFPLVVDPLFDPNPSNTYNYVGICKEVKNGMVVSSKAVPLH